MVNKEEILKIAKEKGQIKTKDLVGVFNVSRQHVSAILRELIKDGKLVKLGSTNKAFYTLPDYASSHLEILPTRIKKSLKNKGLEEHEVLEEIENNLPLLLKLPENVRSIFTYAFSEMLNNAIEHSKSDKIEVEVVLENKKLRFYVNDYGIGVFRNVMKDRGLKSELEAMQDLLKGKTTTQPKSHSGEGIFFTSKAADQYELESYGYQLVVDNNINDVFFNKVKADKRGTKVSFIISTDSARHLNDVFKQYTSKVDSGSGFDKTEIKVKLYTIGGVYVSRSQARRILAGLEKFKSIILDFEKVPMVGQAFSDEVFRVFKNRHPAIKIKSANMNEAVKFMIDRVEGNNPRSPKIFEE